MSAALEARLAAKFVAGGTLDTDSPLDALTDRELERPASRADCASYIERSLS